MVATDDVTARIVRRYANPARTAYLYLFRLKPGGELGPIVPEADSVLAAWADEGEGLLSTPPDEAVRKCAAAHAVGLEIAQTPQKLTPHQRRQLMARSILFTVEQISDSVINVHRFSRALAFSPKGDRKVTEEWHPSNEGWYSSYRPPD